MALSPVNIADENRWTSWYVLTTHDPVHLESLIVQENARQNDLYECYCPYTTLPEEAQESRAKNVYSLRAALRRYVFVRTLKTTEERLFIEAVIKWSRSSVHPIFLLRNDLNSYARVSDYQLNVMKACCDEVLFKPTSSHSIRDFKIGQKIKLSNTPFAESDQGGVIQSVTRKKGGLIELRVEMTLFNVKFPNLLVTYEDADEGNALSRLVYDAQQKLLPIFQRKVNGKETEASRRLDEKTLQQILSNSDVSIPEGAMKRHYLALMLIAARLVNNKTAILQFSEKINAELAALSCIRESKAATDSRAWLHIALFIATGKPQYRNLAKAYIRQYNPKSSYLLQFVKTSCKTAGEKWIGVKKK